jgi:hypothetical protein
VGSGLVSGLGERSKLFFGQSALEKKNAVHVSMGCVVVVNGCDELKVSAELFFNYFYGLAGNVL